jgi:membrane protease YdiL (CAAX protease family)
MINKKLRLFLNRYPPGFSALLEVGILFLPAIPAYIWMWPRLDGSLNALVRSITYVYVLAGTLIIGLRRWSLNELGLNRKGLWLSLSCALSILVGRLLIILSIQWEVQPARLTIFGLFWDLFYYFALVALTEELLFRGLIYHALSGWLGLRWAILGSSFGFLLWHVFGQGPLIGLATFFIGLLFALIRWRAGGIIGLIVLHGLWDLESVLLISDSSAQILSNLQPPIASLAMLWLGTALLFLPVVFLLWFPGKIRASSI